MAEAAPTGTAAHTDTVAVVGAGIVGVCCALELQRRGAQVTLIDRGDPGGETSFGNAGVIARSSLMPLNHPGLWATLPALARNRSAQLRYRPGYLARNLGWLTAFLYHAQPVHFAATATALDALIRLSGREHRRLLGEAGAAGRLRDTGWLHLYRTEQAWAGARRARQTYERFGVDVQPLDAHGLSDLEPDLRALFPRALWVKDSASVDSPLRVVQAYARLFAERGGVVRRADVVALERGDGGAWRLHDRSGGTLQARSVVLALGPWAQAFLARLGLAVPMAFERGYHMHYRPLPGGVLHRPVYDTGGGYVLTPMEQGLRLCTGVELNALDAPVDPSQLASAEASARQALALGERLDPQPWLGRRPTLPDSRPIVGAAARHPGVWLAFGHQHIGFSTGPGTAAVLGALMSGQAPPVDAAPFQPERFIR